MFARTEKNSYFCKRKTETHRGHKDNKARKKIPTTRDQGQRITKVEFKVKKGKKIMSMMTFIALVAVAFVGASALALTMDRMVEGK